MQKSQAHGDLISDLQIRKRVNGTLNTINVKYVYDIGNTFPGRYLVDPSFKTFRTDCWGSSSVAVMSNKTAFSHLFKVQYCSSSRDASISITL